ncbi:MAG TPA: CDP-glucose 4,6-dehydratase, partial [Candidatus Sulfomarinibacteraceae bacterium]|nr:CDP-glucose 4,6-dehydratase [Candidatus Sulfomarinibacteraceae bacterium]
MNDSFANIFQDLPVLVTGHTGFKGSWLTVWLRELGARVTGFSLPEPPTRPSNFELCRLGSRMPDERGDVRDLHALQRLFDAHRPQVVFHLAAQPLVPTAYENPKETFDTNVGGTVNLLEAVRASDTVRAVVCVTTDKVYENREWVWGYRENDRLGGHDPYSASKAMAELAVASFRRSFFAEGAPAVATARAGNVIGGGDFTDDRLLPDCMRALMAQKPLWVGNPLSVRPWQHVLESL